MDWLSNQRAYAAFQYSGAGLVTLRKPKLLSHWLTVGRGCVFDCIYCGGGKESHSELAGRNGYVMRTPEGVAADVARLAAQGFQQVNLSLDIATFPAKWWRAFFQQLRHQNVRIGRAFGGAVARAVHEGRLPYREAYMLTGLSGGTFEKFMEWAGASS